MKERNHLFEIRGPAMVDNVNAGEINAGALSVFANSRFIPKDRYARDSLARRERRGNDSSGIVAFGQNNMLGTRCGALADAFENVHRCLWERESSERTVKSEE
jgi:hypothetical protein